jgi:predicted aspartyl protease
MGLTHSPVTITNPFDPTKVIECEALVDTGASYLTLPTAWKDALGILDLVDTVEIETATQELVSGELYGPVKVRVKGFRAAYSEVLFIEMKPDNGRYEPLLGCLPLEAAGITVDPISHRLMKGRVLARKAQEVTGRQPVTSVPSIPTYREFTLESTQSLLGVKHQFGKLFDVVESVAVPPWLLKSLEAAQPIRFTSDKARSGFLITPILLASREINQEKFFIFSGQRLAADATRGLIGECDFILTHSASPVLSAPIMAIVVEARRQDFELGLGQCIAQMAGAQIFNQKHGDLSLPIFGCVTTGDIWQFLKLEASLVLIEQSRYYINNLGQILGVFKNIVDFYEARHSLSEL